MLFRLILLAVILCGGYVRGQCVEYCPSPPPAGQCSDTCMDDVDCGSRVCCENSCGGLSCMAAASIACNETECSANNPCPEPYQICTVVNGCTDRCLPP